jgi:predicted dehydrogenase
MADTPVRIGLVGHGFGGRRFHAPLIASAAGAELAGVVTRSPQRRVELEADHPGTPAFDTLAGLAAAGAEAVAISTPADTHIPLLYEAIDLGLAAVVDKPFAPDAATARAAVEAAEQAGLTLSVYQNRRWDSDFLTVRRLLRSGALGEVVRFESAFERFDPSPPPTSGGGILLDFGSHLFDQALVLFGPVASVHAEVLEQPQDGGLEHGFFAALRHRDGMTSHLAGNWREGAPGPRFRVTGTEGSYVVAGMDGQEQALIDGRSPASEGDGWGVEPEERWGVLRRGDAGEPVPSERGRWDTYYPAFAAAVRGAGPVPVDPWDAVRSLEVIDAARASGEGGIRTLERG